MIILYNNLSTNVLGENYGIGKVISDGDVRLNYPSAPILYGTLIKFTAIYHNSYSVFIAVEMVGGGTSTGRCYIAIDIDITELTQWKLFI